jgi:ATP-dependent Clp protease adaptor protein ClpS
MTEKESGKTELIDQPQIDTRTPPPYKVILHNDDVNDMLYVVETICKLTPLGVEQATKKMMEAHHKGFAILLVCHKERAELYQEQFHSCRLIVTIEPD